MKKKIFSILLIAVLVLSSFSAVFAADDGQITITNTQKGQEYEAYLIFTAIPGANNSVSYKLADGIEKEDLAGSKFSVDAQGNVSFPDGAELDAADIAVLKAIVDAGKAEKVASDTAAAEGEEVVLSGLPNGYYYVTSTTGTAVSINTAAKEVTVEDKNPPTTIDKEIESVEDDPAYVSVDEAMAQVGKTINYKSTIPIKKGAYNYKFTDNMTESLTLDEASVKVYIDGTEVTGYGDLTTVATTDKDNITIEFSQTFLEANVGKDIVIKYSAKLNDKAVIGSAGNPNVAKITYGNEDNPLTDEDDAKVYTAKVGVNKTDGDNKPLEGAGFKLMNEAGKYYTYTAEGGVVWVDSADDADERFTDKDGKIEEFKGLTNGTYTLTESTVPAGYNSIADKTITIAGANFTDENLIQTEDVVNQAGQLLPGTGGIGTTIFYILGAALVLGAGAVLVTRRKADR